MQQDRTRTPPHNLEAEESVIGSLLIGGELNLISLSPSDFFTDSLGTIFQACLCVVDKGGPLNTVLVADELSRMGKLAVVGGAAVLSRLVANCPTSLDLEFYADIVKRDSVFRQLILAGRNIENMGFEAQGEVGTVLQTADDIILALQRMTEQAALITPEERMKRQANRYEALFKDDESKAMPTGLTDLDYQLGGGIFPGDLVIVGARPGMGKTTFLQQIGNLVASNRSVLFASGEMNEDSLTDRDVAAELKVPITVIRSGEFRYQDGSKDDLFLSVLQSLEAIGQRRMFLFCGNRGNAFTTVNLNQVASKIQTRFGLALIVVDYLGLLRDRYGNNQVERLGYISAALKAMAMELNVPILCAHQLNRGAEMREDKRPQLHDLRDSGNIEQDADVVMFLYRDNYYGYSKNNTTEIILAKQRQGPGNENRKISVAFDQREQRYKDLTRESLIS